jgi:hypothetical protein
VAFEVPFRLPVTTLAKLELLDAKLHILPASRRTKFSLPELP